MPVRPVRHALIALAVAPVVSLAAPSPALAAPPTSAATASAPAVHLSMGEVPTGLRRTPRMAVQIPAGLRRTPRMAVETPAGLRRTPRMAVETPAGLRRTPRMAVEAPAGLRRTPRMDVYINGQVRLVDEGRSGPLASLPSLPRLIDPITTATYMRGVLEGLVPIPEPIVIQTDHIVRACKAIEAAGDPSLLGPLTA